MLMCRHAHICVLYSKESLSLPNSVFFPTCGRAVLLPFFYLNDVIHYTIPVWVLLDPGWCAARCVWTSLYFWFPDVIAWCCSFVFAFICRCQFGVSVRECSGWKERGKAARNEMITEWWLPLSQFVWYSQVSRFCSFWNWASRSLKSN